MKIQETIDYHITSTFFAMRRMYNLLATRNGITHGIGYALTYIGKEGTPATKIAPMMGMTSSSLSRLLKTMEEEDIIYREPDRDDKRVVRIFLTPKGFELKEKVKKAVFRFNNMLFENISKEDLDAFVRVNHIIKEQVKEEITAFQEKNKLSISK